MLLSFDELTCVVCENGDDEAELMICDGCDRGFHSFCLNLPTVPVGDWYCSACLQKNKLNKFKLEPRGVVYLYERISSRGQDNPKYGRVGLDTQNISLLQFVLNTGLVIKNTIREIESAYHSKKSRVINSCIEKMEPNECLLVYSVSRFSRNLQEGIVMLNIINSRHAYVYSVSENVYSYEDNFLTLIKSAETESTNLGLKVAEAHKRIKILGGHIGVVPYGFRVYRNESGIRKLEGDPVEMKAIQIIKSTKPTVRLIDLLNKNKMSYRGKPWTIPVLKRIHKKYNINIKHNINKKNNINNNNIMHDLKKTKSMPYTGLMKGFVKDLLEEINYCD